MQIPDWGHHPGLKTLDGMHDAMPHRRLWLGWRAVEPLGYLVQETIGIACWCVAFPVGCGFLSSWAGRQMHRKRDLMMINCHCHWVVTPAVPVPVRNGNALVDTRG
jgi:hypothetical protein